MADHGLRRNFGDILRNIREHQLERSAVFAINDMNYIDQDAPTGIFQPDASYLRIRLNEFYLKNSRELWKTYYPLTLAFTQCIYAGRWEEVPFVVGPELLTSLDKIELNDYISFRNTTIMGPIPYSGNDVTLFLGLMRVQKDNWSQHLVSFVEEMGRALNVPQLSLCLNIARPLTSSLEKLLTTRQNIHPCESRTFAQPIGSLNDSTLRPSTIVMLGKSEREISSSEFWIKENRLFYGRTIQTAKPYSESDYLMYSIEHQTKRSIAELGSMDFYQKHWLKAKSLALQGQSGAAFQELTLLLASIAISPDLTQDDQLGLLIAFPGLLNQYLLNFQKGIEGVASSLKNTQTFMEKGKRIFSDTIYAAERAGLGVEATKGIFEAQEYFVSQIASPTKSVDGDDVILEQALSRGKLLNSKALSPNEVALGLGFLRYIS